MSPPCDITPSLSGGVVQCSGRPATMTPSSRPGLGFGQGPGLRLRADRVAVELGGQPVEAVEVVAQAGLGVVLGMAQDADRAAIAAVPDGPQDREVLVPLPQR